MSSSTADGQPKSLDDRVAALEKAAKEEDAKKIENHGFEFNTEDWNLKFWDIFAVVAVTKALTLIKIELPPLIDAGKIVETALEKKLGRARGEWGWLFSRKGDSPEVLVDRLREEINTKFTQQGRYNHSFAGRIETLQRGLDRTRNRLDNTERTASTVQRGLRNTNRRLQQTQGTLRTYQQTIRRESSALAGPGSPGSRGDAERLRELETRVNGLVRVLGT
ncbi:MULTISPECIES: hypothetical protein [Streptomyces]|uniref:Uncharacterized protein n=1 Tax=Streptomyces evansiae TaxID=3075535 RepID=A0ABU2R6C1_9ACTN|nr:MULTISPECIES: hypothetical protein [unclassified Streptomyces]MDT0412239.1 hypothetical protein [Streptomyces sp. DSM 41979]